MHGHELLIDLTIITGISLAIHLLAIRFKLDTTSGLLLAGVAVSMFGPNGLNMLGGIDAIKFLAEIGVGILLLQVGMEFTTKKLLRMWKDVLWGGLIQMSLTALLGAIAYFTIFNNSISTAFFVGLLMAMSSTVLIIKHLQEKRIMSTPAGQLCVGILLFQDISLLPLALIAPAFGESDASAWQITQQVSFGIVAIIVAFVLEAKLIGPVLDYVKKTRNQTSFLITVCFICLLTATIAGSVGLSPALGLFMGGVLISGTDYRHEVFGTVEKFRDLLAPVFFVSIGMLFNPWLLFDTVSQTTMILASLVGMVAIKFICAYLTGLIRGLGKRNSIRAGGALAQVGEMSFILAGIGFANGALNQADYDVFIFLAVVTMLLTPLIISYSNKLADTVSAQRSADSAIESISDDEVSLWDHLILVGFGSTGRSVAEALYELEQSVLVVELDKERFDRESDSRFPKLYGDICDPHTLEVAGLEHAQTVFLAFDDIEKIEQAIDTIHGIRSDIIIVARTRSHSDAKKLLNLKNVEVLIAEIGESMEGIDRVCQVMGLPAFGRARLSKIIDLVSESRAA